jgi:hypothetical protein
MEPLTDWRKLSMSNFKTSDYCVGIVYGLLASITKPKYIKTKPTAKTDAEYIVINALPITADVMQKVYINVNYHVKDIALGIPDMTKIEAGSNAVLTILKKVSTSAYLIDFESQETIREDEIGEHFSNLRFSFKNINNS